MSNRNNVVFNVLPTDSNTAILAKNLTPEDLTPGKVGFFNAETGVSFDNTSTDIPNEMFIAVGKADGGFRMSAGQNIQKKGILGFQRKDYEAGAPMTVKVSGFKPKFDSSYGLRIEFRNSHIYRIQGHNQYSKAYVVKTPTQLDCGGDECLDANLLARQLLQEILLDENNGLSARLVADQAIVAVDVEGISADIAEGDEVTQEQVDLLVTHNALAGTTTPLTTSIEITPDTVSGGDFSGGINLKYHKLLQTFLLVSPIEKLNEVGTKITSTPLTYTQGDGNSIMQKEYHASSWNGAGPYAVSETTNTAIGNIEYMADKNTDYTQFALEYNVKSHGGFLEYENPLTTIIALPSGHSTAINSVSSMLGKLV